MALTSTLPALASNTALATTVVARWPLLPVIPRRLSVVALWPLAAGTVIPGARPCTAASRHSKKLAKALIV